jgi:hypothetical protein
MMKCLKISLTYENGHSLLVNYDELAFKYVVSPYIVTFFIYIGGIGKLLENMGGAPLVGRASICDCCILKLKEEKSKISIWLKKMVLLLHICKVC